MIYLKEIHEIFYFIHSQGLVPRRGILDTRQLLWEIVHTELAVLLLQYTTYNNTHLCCFALAYFKDLLRFWDCSKSLSIYQFSLLLILNQDTLMTMSEPYGERMVFTFWDSVWGYFEQQGFDSFTCTYSRFLIWQYPDLVSNPVFSCDNGPTFYFVTVIPFYWLTFVIKLLLYYTTVASLSLFPSFLG